MAGFATGHLGSLLDRLQAFKVDWKFSFVPAENTEYEAGIDREVADLVDANVISSMTKTSAKVSPAYRRHAVLLDIDYEAHLIPSSTPGHYHLYLDVPGGVPHEKYMTLLALLADCGIIEKGFADVSIARGHSDLRLPWVTKDEQRKHAPGPGVDLQGIEVPGTPPPVIDLESDLF